jgi:hypothetical protein
MKKIKINTILIAVWMSIFLMILISSVSAQDTTKVQKAILINQKTILKNQDTIMKNQDSIKKQQPQRKLTDMEKKEMEYRDWQQRSKSIDEDGLRDFKS